MSIATTNILCNNGNAGPKKGDARDGKPASPSSKNTSYNASHHHHQLLDDTYQEILVPPNTYPTTVALLADINQMNFLVFQQNHRISMLETKCRSHSPRKHRSRSRTPFLQ